MPGQTRKTKTKRRVKKNDPKKIRGVPWSLDEHSLFDPGSKEGQSSIETWHLGKSVGKWSLILAIGAFFLQWWWLIPVFAFFGMMGSSVASSVEAKSNTGYPHLEHTDAMGLGVAGCLLFIICFVAFIGSFYLPSDGWDTIFTEASSEQSTTTSSSGSSDE